jgi:CDP-glucose 4,6-dehydratase
MDEFWVNRRVLVTGYSGFLGRWLVATLIKKGAVVVGVARKSLPDLFYPINKGAQNFYPIQADVGQDGIIGYLLKTYQIDAVFHLAAQAIVSEAAKTPLPTFTANIQGTWQLLEACRLQPTVTRVVLMSTEKVYGHTQGKQFCYENDALLADTPYAVSKACADMLAQTYYASYGLPVGIARGSNLYGAGDLNSSRIVPGTIHAILSQQNPTILSDGSPKRDYLFVQDMVDALLLQAQALERGDVAGKAFNFASGVGVSVLDVILQLLAVAGRSDLAPIVLNTAKPELPQPLLSIQQSKQVLGWQPKVGLREGLAATFDWYQKALALAAV